MKLLALAALTSGLVLARPAHAGSASAWAAAKANLPKDTTVLVGLDLVQLSKSSLWGLAVPFLLSSQPDLKDAVETIKTSCDLDPLKVVQAVVLGTDDDQKHGAVYVALAGVDQPKLAACFQAVAKAKGKDAAVKTDGKITELAVGDKSVFVTWPSASVVAVSIDLASRDQLVAWTGGARSLAKSKVARGMGRVATTAAVWAVSATPRDLDLGKKMKTGYASVKMSAGNLALDAHMQVGSAGDAKSLAENATKDLANLAQDTDTDDAVKEAIKNVTVTSAGDETIVKAALPESSLMQLLLALKK